MSKNLSIYLPIFLYDTQLSIAGIDIYNGRILGRDNIIETEENLLNNDKVLNSIAIYMILLLNKYVLRSVECSNTGLHHLLILSDRSLIRLLSFCLVLLLLLAATRARSWPLVYSVCCSTQAPSSDSGM